MKNIDKRWFVFIILVIILSSGLSFLAFNQESRTSQEDSSIKDTTRMNIALVNEDRGAVFNNSEVAFGDAFVKSLDKNDTHEWFVVSRGVAESGLENNQYDMMIVIPNDFSEKALSIEVEAPEQVVLNYKINTSDNEKVKTEAEKTASTILNDFNRQIIDVYFASIIGNLQEAQDNIKRIVEKQKVYTDTYTSTIYNPLDGYTSQFKSIKDHTKTSKDIFSDFEETMENYENQLVDGAELEQNYLSSLDEVSEIGENNSLALLKYYDSLQQFDQTLNHGDVEGRLQQLQLSNKMIQNQFRNPADKVTVTTFDQSEQDNIVSGVASLQTHLQTSLNKVQQAEKLLEERLNPEGANSFKDNVRERLDVLFSTAFAEDDLLKDILFGNLEDNVTNYMNEQISKLPSLSTDDFEGYDLPSKTLTEIKNVIAVTKEIVDEDEIENDTEILPDYIKRLKNHLANNGVTMTDTVILPENKESEQLFTLDIPKGYAIKKLKITMPGGKDIIVKNLEDNSVILPKNKEGQFSVELTLLLENTDKKLNVFKPITWSWEINQEYTTKGKETKPEVENPVDEHEKGKDEKENNEEEDASTDSENEMKVELLSQEIPNPENVEENQPNEATASVQKNTMESDPTENHSDENELDDMNPEKDMEDSKDTLDTDNESRDEDVGNKDENIGNDDKGNDDKPTPPEPIIKKVKVVNNKIHHKVMDPVVNMDNGTKELYEKVIHTVSPYDKLFSMYELYFGLDMDNPELIEELDSKPSLTDIAAEKEHSLYYLFNEKDIGELLQDYVVKQVIDDVTEEIRQPLENLQERIQQFHTEVNTANQNASNLAQRVAETTIQAAILNESLDGMLKDVANWRERSLDLVEQQNEIIVNDDNEKAAIVNLGNEFQPLLAKSERLANEAQTNVQSAESVYETFDTIDQQADVIQTSGVNLVNQAEELSENITNNLLQDQEFASNFADVLANSRIGDRQNEELYDFLSNPVLTSNEGAVRAASTSDTFTPYYLVMICFILVLFTAYVISTFHQKKSDNDQFETEKTIMALNAPITLITAGIGVLEGIIVGVVSSYYLALNEANMILFILLIILLTTAMLLIATYLLRQLKMIGMFLLLTVLSLYLFLTDALGTTSEGMKLFRVISPLQYVESLLNGINQGNLNYFISFLVVIGLVILGALANLFVVRFEQEKGDLDEDERKAEAN